MASIAIDSEGGGKAPISLHRAFPVVVSLWFAALLGLGTLLVPIALLERVILAAGIASAVPAAAPPLGMTARLGIALAGTLGGALFGWIVARRVAEAHQPTATARFHGSAENRRPLSASEDLDEDGIGAAAPTKRRSLAMAEDERKSDFLWAAPLPGEDAHAEVPAPEPQPEPAAEPVFTRREAIGDIAEDEASEAFELSEFADETAETADLFADPEDAAFPAEDEAPAMQFPTSAEIERRRTERRRAGGARAPGGFERRLYLRRLADEPLPFVAPSLARRTPDNENAASDTLAVRMNFDGPAVPAFDQAEAFPDVTTDWQDAPLGELGMIDLVQRLAASLEKRRAFAAAPAPVVAVQAVEPEPQAEEFAGSLDGVEAAAPDEAAEAMAAYFAKSAAPEASHEAADADELPEEALAPEAAPDADDDEALAASFSLPLAQTWTRAEPISDPIDDRAGEDEAEAEPDDAGFGSLLSLRNPFTEPREEFVRVDLPSPEPDEIEPVVVFASAPAPRTFDPPSATGAALPAASAPAESDEALRRALATLQRMSRGG